MNNNFTSDLNGIKTQQSNITVGHTYLVDARNIVFSKDGYIQSRTGFNTLLTLGANSSVNNNYTNETVPVSFFYDETLGYNRFVAIDSTRTIPTSFPYTQSQVGVFSAIHTYDNASIKDLVNTTPTIFKNENNAFILDNFGLNWELYRNRWSRFQFPNFRMTETIFARQLVAPDLNIFGYGKKFGIAYSMVYDTSDAATSGANLIYNRDTESEIIFEQVQVNLIPNDIGFSNNNVNGSQISPTYSLIPVNNTAIKTACCVQLRIAPATFWTESSPGPLRVKIRIYRTIQVNAKSTIIENGVNTLVDTALPVEYYQACQDVVVNYSGYITNAPLYIYLNLNDDGIIATGVSIRSDWAAAQTEPINHETLGAKNVTEYKKFFIYSNIKDPGFREFTFNRQLGANVNATFNYSLSENGTYSTSSPLTFTTDVIVNDGVQANLNNFSFNSSLTNDEQLKFTGLSGVFNNFVLSAGNRFSQVKSNGELSSSTVTINTTNVVISNLVDFDISEFAGVGIAAISQTGGKVIYVFSYKNVTKTNTNEYTFGEPSFYGYRTNGTVTGSIFKIPGTAGASLPVYLSQTPQNPVTTAALLSLLPCAGMISTPVGQVNSWSTLNNATCGSIFYYGIKALSPSQIIDSYVDKLIINNIKNDIKIRKGSTPGSFTVEILDKRYSYLAFSANNFAADAITPSLNATFSTTMNSHVESSNLPNGIQISKANRPEIISYEQFLTPIEVDSRNSAIQNIKSNSDAVYVLKETSTFKLLIDTVVYQVQVLKKLMKKLFGCPKKDLCLLVDKVLSLLVEILKTKLNKLFKNANRLIC
jgi:hypothetical protein